MGAAGGDAAFTSAVPIVPARGVRAAAEWYRDRLGFQVVHTEEAYGIVARDAIEIHFWGPSGIRPEDSMSMFRVGVQGIDRLYDACSREAIVHPNAPLVQKPWGTREFAVVDGDGNLLTFFERV